VQVGWQPSNSGSPAIPTNCGLACHHPDDEWPF